MYVLLRNLNNVKMRYQYRDIRVNVISTCQIFYFSHLLKMPLCLANFENVQLTNENPDECHPIDDPSTLIADEEEEEDVDLVYKEYQEWVYKCGEVSESLTVAGLNSGVTSHAAGQSSGVTSHAAAKEIDELLEFSFRDFMKVTQGDAHKANDKEEEGSDRDDVKWV